MNDGAEPLIVTEKAPEFVLLALEVFCRVNAALVVAPLLVIDCSVLLFQIVIAPVVALTAVSVPAVTELTPPTAVALIVTTCPEMVADVPVVKLAGS